MEEALLRGLPPVGDSESFSQMHEILLQKVSWLVLAVCFQGFLRLIFDLIYVTDIGGV